VWRHRPARRIPWVLTLLGYSGWVLGDGFWILDERLLGGAYGVPVEATYLLSYVALGAGTLSFVRSRRSRRDVDALLDASIVTAGVGVVVTVFVVAPVAGDSTLSLPFKLLATAYPLGDLFLLGVIARLSRRPGAHGLVPAADGVPGRRPGRRHGVQPRPAQLGHHRALEVRGLAPELPAGGCRRLRALDARAGRARARPCGVRIGHRRLVALAAGLVLPGVTLLADGMDGDGVQWQVTGTGSLLLCCLVLVRMIGLLRTVSVQADRLAELARYDALTGAPNRRTWDEELAGAARVAREHATTLCVAILDLDHFKAYNDEHGHQAGDRLLRDAVAAWTAALPPGTLLGAYGGEEFTVLLPATGPEEARLAVLGLRDATPEGRTFSAGVAACPPGADPAAALAAADEALYEAKRRGRDRVVVHGDVKLSALPRRRRPAGADDGDAADRRHPDVRRRRVRGAGPGCRRPGRRRARAASRRRSAVRTPTATATSSSSWPSGPRWRSPAARPATTCYVNVSAPALVSRRGSSPGCRTGWTASSSSSARTRATSRRTTSAVALDVLRSRGARVALDDLGAGPRSSRGWRCCGRTS
jgi:diguanylate cyclase (GGDEF)-like protein